MNNEYLVTPTISYDINLGKQVNYIDINASLLGDIMQHYGMDDESIAKTEILISNKSNIVEKNGDRFVLGGHYDRLDESIVVFVADDIDISRKINNEYYSKYSYEYYDSSYKEDEVLNKQVSSILSETILHELQHRIDFSVHGEKFVHKQLIEQIENKFNNPDKQFGKAFKYTTLGALTSAAALKFIPGNEKLFFLIPCFIAELYGFSKMPRAVYNSIKSIRYIKSHQGYLDRPHEVRAREFSDQMVRYLGERQLLPVNIDINKYDQ
jgi:hypothetical protein